MNRRDFIKTVAVAAAATAVKFPNGTLFGADTAAVPDIVVVRNGEAAAMFRQGIAALGGMGRFVKPGQKVVLKPNIGWNRTPEEGANTNPELVAEIVREALAAGASEVIVFDHTCNAEAPCYKNSGIEAAVEAAGGKMAHADRTEQYQEVNRPDAVVMKKALIHKAVLEADVFINIPVLKNHGGAKMTAAMKNFMGIVYDRGYMHKNNLMQCIADSVLYRKPELNVIDAYRVMPTNGPRGTGVKDVKLMKYQILSADIVAADAMSARLLGYKTESIPYIAMGEKLGLGTADYRTKTVKRIDA